ncbi:MAG: ParB/RepB/Spo0J family partition protein [Rikenellaceae bacterium]|nr:ParB/RepB/Spo0J family partition protein [Rikenellaceae bacterium]MBR2442932.1 ParB/RepB/Spo0J family partition protein [Rikenellaceae bacterium]
MAKGLGRGLDAIFGQNSVAINQDSNIGMQVAVDKIVPNPTQPRTVFDEAALEELTDSIRVLGIIQPITVKPEGDKYIIISGERRWRAACAAGLETVPVFVRDVEPQNLHEMALVENIQRQDLNAMEVALSLKRLMDECELTQDKLSERVGKKRSTIANYLRLLNLPPEVQLAVREELISMGHAKVIASASDEKQLPLLRKCLKKSLSVRQLEEYAAKLANAKSAAEVEEEEYPESYGRLVEVMERYFSENISIKTSKNGKGKIIIEFSGEQDIERFIAKLNK